MLLLSEASGAGRTALENPSERRCIARRDVAVGRAPGRPGGSKAPNAEIAIGGSVGLLGLTGARRTRKSLRTVPGLLDQIVPITASGLLGEKPLVKRINVG